MAATRGITIIVALQTGAENRDSGPLHFRLVPLELPVRRQDRELLGLRLRDEQPIEWIMVMGRQRRDAQRMSVQHREGSYSGARHPLRHERRGIPRQRQLAERVFDGDLPGTGGGED
jgi:hypothetical protein